MRFVLAFLLGLSTMKEGKKKYREYRNLKGEKNLKGRQITVMNCLHVQMCDLE